MSGDMAGYAINQAAHMARLAWDPIVDNIEFALSERVGFESWLIDKRICERVYVYGDAPRSGSGRGSKRYDKGWLGLGPEDLNGIHRYEVTLEPERPNSRILDTRVHREMLDLELETTAMAIEAMGNDPVAVEKGRLIEMMKREPEVIAQLKQVILRELATIDQKALAGAVEEATAR